MMRRFLAAMVGGGVLLGGLLMVVLPGPAVLVIPLGLMILATEFFWARRCLDQCRRACDRLGFPRKIRAWLRWMATRRGLPGSAAAGRATGPLPRWLP